MIISYQSYYSYRRNRWQKNTIVSPFKLCGENLNEVTNTKYLGHYLSADGKDDIDMNRACRQVYAQGNSLIRKFHMCTEKVKIKLFVTYCSQLYCAPVWHFKYSDKSYKKLNVAYNNVFRSFLRLPRDAQGRPCSASGMFVNRRVRSFQEILRNLVFKFQCRLNQSQNELVVCTLSDNVSSRSKLRNHWEKLLHLHNIDEG